MGAVFFLCSIQNPGLTLLYLMSSCKGTRNLSFDSNTGEAGLINRNFPNCKKLFKLWLWVQMFIAWNQFFWHIFANTSPSLFLSFTFLLFILVLDLYTEKYIYFSSHILLFLSLIVFTYYFFVVSHVRWCLISYTISL